MARNPMKTNLETPFLRNPCTLPLTRNVGVPLMATLNLLGFTLGLLVWLFSTPTILNAPGASQVSSLYQGHQNTASPSPVFDSPAPSTSCGGSLDTSSRKSKRSKRRRNRKKAHKQGGTHSTSASQVEPHHTASAVHDGGTYQTSTGHVGLSKHSTSASQVDLHHLASVDHAGGILPTFLGHVGSSHSASMVHAEDTRSTSIIQVEPPHPSSTSHVGSIHPASMVHAGGTHSTVAKHVDPNHSAFVVHVDGACPTSTSHVGPSLSASASLAGGSLSASMVHDGDNPSATASHVDTVEKTTRSKHKPKFPCKLCEGDHLTYKFPSIVEVRRDWFHGHPVFEHSEVFQQPSSLSQVGPSHPTSGGHVGGNISASIGHTERK